MDSSWPNQWSWWMLNSSKIEWSQNNIIHDIGRDHWDYSNDKVIGTGHGWNWNVVQSNLHKEEAEDSLLRASGPINIVDTSGKKTNATNTFVQDQARVISYADYADLDVLNKEFMLGKGLLLKAIDNITPEYLNSLKEHNNANESEIQLISTLLNLLEVLNRSKNFNQLNSWDDVCEYLNENLISQLVNASENIQQRNYDREVLYQIREEFKVKPDSKNQNDVLVNIKEVMWEIFCLIDIIDEIATIKGKARYVRYIVNKFT